MPKTPSKVADRQSTPPVTTTIQQITSFSGPLPAPDDLEKYGKLINNGIERIVAMAEKEQAARLAIAKQDSLNSSLALKIRFAALKGAMIRRMIGTFASLIVALAIVYTAYLVTMAGHEGVGVALAALPIAGVVKWFIWPGRK